MDMKRLEISRLMDEYQDNEFFPEGGGIADTQVVKGRVLTLVAPAKKRRSLPLTKVLIAAALAVGCVLCIAAGLPQTVSHLISGDFLIFQTDPNNYLLQIDLRAAESDPLILENGRLWLVLDGERTDITDRIDEATPYIIEDTDPDTGLKNYLILGGTPEDFGWQWWAEIPQGGYVGGGENTYDLYYMVDGEQVDINDWRASVSYNGDGPIPTDLLPEEITVNKPWWEKGYAQVGIWD